MRLHTVIITHDRLELTKRAVSSYLETVSVPHTLLVVDNASTDGTQAWLLEQQAAGLLDVLLIARNRYPGFACNRGWERAPDDADFLQRGDNDFSYVAGWCEEAMSHFEDATLGQLGMRTDDEEAHCAYNVGGNCIIRRELFEAGLRYDERPWDKHAPGLTEDTFLSPDVIGYGYRWGRVSRHCIQDMAIVTAADPYYRRTWKARRMDLGGR